MLLPRLISVVQLRLLPLYLASAIFFGISPSSLCGQETPPAPSAQSMPPAAPQPAQPQAVNLKDYFGSPLGLSSRAATLHAAGTRAAEPGQLAAHRRAYEGWQDLSIHR